MKIGLITYHIEKSPGATLQTYATCRALKELGCDVLLIDLMHKNYNHGFWGWLICEPYYFLRDIRQKKFRQEFYPNLTRHYKSLDELKKDPPKLDAYCVGSDQTWNKTIAGKNYMAYFLDFGDETVKRFSYAASIGLTMWPIEDYQENIIIEKLLRSYIGLSVREPTAAKILLDKFSISPQVVCDPALLHENYNEIIGQPEQKNEIACFLFNRSKELLSSLDRISSYYNAPLRMVLYQFPIKGFKYTYAPDMVRWLKYLASSICVVTDSFHGTVVAILYKKPFVVIYQENGKSSRIADLLNRLDLRDRMFSSVDEFRNSEKWKEKIDWVHVHGLLEQYRIESWDYLHDVIEKISMSKNP